MASLQARAQSVHGGFEIGAHVVALAYEDGFDIWQRAFRPSYSLFAFGSLRVRGPLFITSGLRYVRLGNRIEYDGDATQVRTLPDGSVEVFMQRTVGDFRITQHYLSVPFRIGYDLKADKYFVFLGPEIGRLLSATIVGKTRTPAVSRTEDDITDRVKPWNVALSFGAGVRVHLKGRPLLVQAMYSNGLVGVADGNWFSDWKTQEIGITAGYLLW